MVGRPGWGVANVHFPDISVERVSSGIYEKPAEGVVIDARGSRWRIVEVRMPDPDERNDITYEVWVEAVELE
jgi:hypothetical protein